MSALARIPAPKELMAYVQRLLWSSGELGRAVCRRGWQKPEAWALATAETPAEQVLTDRVTRADNANLWLDEWLVAQAAAAPYLSLVAHDPLAPPVDAEAQLSDNLFEGPGRWDVRGEESYLVLSKDAFGPGAIQTVSSEMLGEEYALYVIADQWPFGESRPLHDLVYSVRHVIVPIAEGESYGIISGS